MQSGRVNESPTAAQLGQGGSPPSPGHPARPRELFTHQLLWVQSTSNTPAQMCFAHQANQSVEGVGGCQLTRPNRVVRTGLDADACRQSIAHKRPATPARACSEKPNPNTTTHATVAGASLVRHTDGCRTDNQALGFGSAGMLPARLDRPAQA